jgi:hypothetical protein
MDLFNNPSKYSKFFAGLAGAILTWALATFPENHDVQVWASLVTALMTAYGVYSVRNTDQV